MNQKVTVIETMSALEQYMPLMHNQEPKGVDCETKGLDPHTADLRTLQISDSNNVLVVDIQKVGTGASDLFRPIFEDPSVIKIFHNAKFDMKFIKHHMGIDVEGIFDSYLASILIEAGVRKPRGYHGLQQVLERYTGLNISKNEQRSDWSGELSTEQLTYAAKDAQCLLPLREELIQVLKRLSLIRCAKLEFDAVLPVVWLELCGFYLDIERWKDISVENKEKAYEVAARIYKELEPFIEQGSLFDGPTINLDSPQQITKYFTLYGIPMPDSTKEGILRPLAHRYTLIDDYLTYKKLAKRSSSFGEDWQEYVNSATGRIHSNFSQIGAETGRFSSSSPNLQQIPKENQYRNCFKATEGNTLVSGDYSQIELRILADLANDAYALESFANDVDFHLAMGVKISKKELDQVLKEERDLAKNCNFAIPYGATAYRVAATAKISLAEAEILVNTYFDALPSVKRWIFKQKRNILASKYTRTVSGRMAFFDYDDNDMKSKSQAQRNAVNMPIQGSSADILKRALRLFYNNTKSIQNKIKLVNIVHDEINVEAPVSMKEEVASILTNSMESAAKEYLKRVAVKVDIKDSIVWQK